MWTVEGDIVAVELMDDRVVTITRVYGPGTWLTWDSIKRRVVETYGTPTQDDSFFPSYANDMASKETAIAAKKARALNKWQQPQFTVGLGWLDGDSIVLQYAHDELRAKKKAASKPTH